jgi:hypothetical protein
LDINAVVSLTTTVDDPAANFTFDFIIRRAEFNSFFSDTTLTAQINFPTVNQTEQRYHVTNDVSAVEIFKSDRISLQVRMTSFNSMPVFIDMGLSAGVLF